MSVKKLLSLLLSFCLLLSCAAAEQAAGAEPEKDIVILYTSDVHCGLDEGWGYAGLYAVREYYEKNNHVFLVDNGDHLHGEAAGMMTEGEAIIGIMNMMGYDAAVPGNHDFTYGMDHFLELAGKAEFPYISCNFNREGEPVFPPYLIREAGDVKIAFVGVCTPSTLRSSNPAFFQNGEGEYIYGFMGDESGEELFAAVQKAADDARAEGADYVIVMAHLGNNAEGTRSWVYDQLIINTTGIDAVLDGHSHDTEQVIVKNRDGQDVVRSACGTKLANIGMLTITKEGEISSRLLSWNQDVGAQELLGLENPAADEVNRIRGSLLQELQTVIADLPTELRTDDPTAVREDGSPVRIIRSAETNLGDLYADAFLHQDADADVALLNGGAIRTPLKAGPVTMEDILTMQPYANYVIVAEVKGRQLLDALEWSVNTLPDPFGGFLQVAGLTFSYDERIPSPVVKDENQFFDHVDGSMERRVRSVTVNGQPLDTEKTYRLVTTDYTFFGGDGYTMFTGGRVVDSARNLTYRAFAEYLRDTLHGTLDERYENPYGQGRIVSVHADE